MDTFVKQQTTIQSDCKPIPLGKFSTDKSLLESLEEFGASSSADIWIPLALDQLQNYKKGSELLNSLALDIARVYNPLKPIYSIDLNTSVESFPEIPVEYCNLDTIKMVFAVEMQFAGEHIAVEATIHMCDEIESKMQVGSNNLIDILRNSNYMVKYSSSLSNFNHNDSLSFAPIPIVSDLIGFLGKPDSNGNLDERMRSTIIRRFGLLSGTPETLEEIAKDMSVTRERVRQIEKKAQKRLSYYKGTIIPLKADLKAFQNEIQRCLFSQGLVLTSKDIVARYGRFIDFDGYEPGCAMAFLCLMTGFTVRPLHYSSSSWLLAASESNYQHFFNAYNLLFHPGKDQWHTSTDIDPEDVKVVNEISCVFDLDDIHRIQDIVKRLIGPTKVMRHQEFEQGLAAKCRQENINLEAIIKIDSDKERLEAKDGGLLSKLCSIDCIPAATYEHLIAGKWVSFGLSKRANAVVRAILYAGINENLPISDASPFEWLKGGATTDQIVADMAGRSGYQMTEQALDEFCRRNSNIFSRTGSRSWGVIGAGAMPGIGDSTPKESNRTIIDRLTDVLHEHSGGLSFPELLYAVRETVPKAAEQTVRIYLNTVHSERFEKVTGQRYRLRDSYLEYLANPKVIEPTIDLLTTTMEEAGTPLSIPEIIRLCNNTQFVSQSAIRGYLYQNYGGRFHRTTDGKFVLASYWKKL